MNARTSCHARGGTATMLVAGYFSTENGGQNLLFDALAPVLHVKGDAGTPAGVAEVAKRLGYDAEVAFSRAFKRWIGVAPGAHRRVSAAAAASRESA